MYLLGEFEDKGKNMEKISKREQCALMKFEQTDAM
jgi:hypothetical protein